VLGQAVDPERWRIVPPRAGTANPHLVDFDRTLDHGLLQHSMAVRDSDGKGGRRGGAVRPGDPE
jgi:hypothetical protein